MRSVMLSDGLRLVLHTVRTSPERWGGAKGLTVEEAAGRIGISKVLYRNLESGYTPSTQLSTLVTICESLGVDPEILSFYGYEQVADELRMRVIMGKTMFLDLGKLSVLTPEEVDALLPILDKLARPVGKKETEAA